MEKRGRGEEGRGGEVKKDFRATGGAEGAGKCAQGTRIRAASWQTSAISATKGQQEARAAEGELLQVCVGQPLETLLISEKSVAKFPNFLVGTEIKTTKLLKFNNFGLDSAP